MARAHPTHRPRWYLIPVRVLLVTFVLTLLCFAVTLFLAIVGVFAAAKLRGAVPDMAIAYREIAIPLAAILGVITLITVLSIEIRRYRQARALESIERSSSR